MTMEKAYTNRSEGFACCFWNAPSAEELRALFDKARAPFESIIAVSEHPTSA